MRHRRTTSRGRWFPTAQGPAHTLVTANSLTNSNTVFQPIIAEGLDEPPNVDNFQTTTPGIFPGLLGLTLTSSYLVKRIIGSLFVCATKDPTPQLGVTGVMAFAGIFVERVSKDGQILNAPAWDGLNDDSAQKSWMWRRTWRLGSYNQAPGLWFVYPDSNALYGSQREGTHVDVKSKRRVGYEERLWLATGARLFAGESSVSVEFSTNLRLFGLMEQKS